MTKKWLKLKRKDKGLYLKYHLIIDRTKYKSEYGNYGERGIKCEWMKYEEFKKDMNESYLEHIKKFGKKQTTIERKNNNGNYSKENCKWPLQKALNLQ